MRLTKAAWDNLARLDPYSDLKDVHFDFDPSQDPLDVLQRIVTDCTDLNDHPGLYIVVRPSGIEKVGSPLDGSMYGGVDDPNRWYVIDHNVEPPVVVGWGTCIRRDTP